MAIAGDELGGHRLVTVSSGRENRVKVTTPAPGANGAGQAPVKVAFPGPCSRKLSTPMRLSLGVEDLDEDLLFQVEAGIERAAQTLVDGSFGQALRGDGACCELGRPLERPGEELIGGNDLVDQPDAQRLVGLHLATAEDQVLGSTRTDEPGEPLGTAAAGHDPEQDLGLAELDVVAGDAKVAGEGELAATAERVAGDRRDRHPRQRGHRVERVAERQPDLVRLVGPTELRDVGTGGEDPVATGDHHRARQVALELGRSWCADRRNR